MADTKWVSFTASAQQRQKLAMMSEQLGISRNELLQQLVDLARVTTVMQPQSALTVADVDPNGQK